MLFNDRRPREAVAHPKGKADLNGHLVNDHDYLAGGAGNSARNLPSKAELSRQHDELHARGLHADHEHLDQAQVEQRHFDAHSGDMAECKESGCRGVMRGTIR